MVDSPKYWIRRRTILETHEVSVAKGKPRTFHRFTKRVEIMMYKLLTYSIMTEDDVSVYRIETID